MEVGDVGVAHRAEEVVGELWPVRLDDVSADVAAEAVEGGSGWFGGLCGCGSGLLFDVCGGVLRGSAFDYFVVVGVGHWLSMAWNRVCEACEDYFVGAAVHEVESVEDEPPGETSFYQR